MDTLRALEEDTILDKYGDEAGGLILCLRREIELLKEGNNSPSYWRDKYFGLYDQIGQIADLLGTPRSSNYEHGHVVEALRDRVRSQS